MKAELNLHREQANRLFMREFPDPYANFHFHSQIEIQMVDEGEVEVWVNDQHTLLRAGEVAVAFSYDAHGYRTPKEATVTCMIIPTDLLGEIWPSIRHKRADNAFIRDRAVYEQLKACYRAIKESKSEVKSRGYLYVLLGILMEQMELKERAESVNSQLSTRILFYINENFRQDITLQSIAAALGYNPGYLSRYFKACFNIGINQYVNMIRLREAVLLLREGKNNISYCAFESGFNSSRTFYRAFYEEFHCTPKEYLQQQKSRP